ncbi:hypothetical protein TELCIR_11273 [Teladorsagia circumcincta]|uniref:Reverse transcriptase domain-containing protein n=1 Tax=Teladorsagia circumcincta TaxID=45464 RepID=A0A2G9U9Q7_TELCI|nr:hypothetical protein TELCIR_11273 [Teladorsagia circumcincta]
MSQLDWDDKGNNIDGKKLSNLRFAGDIVLISQRQEDLRQMVKELNEFGRVIGLTINRTKTMVMRNEWADASPIVLESSTLHDNCYVYLESFPWATTCARKYEEKEMRKQTSEAVCKAYEICK